MLNKILQNKINSSVTGINGIFQVVEVTSEGLLIDRGIDQIEVLKNRDVVFGAGDMVVVCGGVGICAVE